MVSQGMVSWKSAFLIAILTVLFLIFGFLLPGAQWLLYLLAAWSEAGVIAGGVVLVLVWSAAATALVIRNRTEREGTIWILMLFIVLDVFGLWPIVAGILAVSAYFFFKHPKHPKQ